MKRTVVGCKTEDRKGQRKNTGQCGQKGDNDERGACFGRWSSGLDVHIWVQETVCQISVSYWLQPGVDTRDRELTADLRVSCVEFMVKTMEYSLFIKGQLEVGRNRTV